MGRAKQTGSRHSEKLALAFDRSLTVAATKVAKVDAKARRTALELALLGDLEGARERFAMAVSARESKAKAQGVDALMRSYVNLLRQSADDDALAEGRGIVGAILGAIQISVEGETRLNCTAAESQSVAQFGRSRGRFTSKNSGCTSGLSTPRSLV